MTERRHGYARYKLDGCRCYVCAFAVSEYEAHRQQAMRTGTWQPFTDAEPTRRHMRALAAAGIGHRRIARLTNLSRTTVRNIAAGRSQIHPDTETAILAITPTLDNAARTTRVPAVGTVRRLRALVAAGWPQTHLVGHIPQAGRIATTNPKTTTARVARDVRDLYARINGLDPHTHGIPAHIVLRTRNRAARQGWPGPACWDDDTIDNPRTHAEWTGKCGTTAGHGIHLREGIPICPPCHRAHTEPRRRTQEAA